LNTHMARLLVFSLVVLVAGSLFAYPWPNKVCKRTDAVAGYVGGAYVIECLDPAGALRCTINVPGTRANMTYTYNCLVEVDRVCDDSATVLVSETVGVWADCSTCSLMHAGFGTGGLY